MHAETDFDDALLQEATRALRTAPVPPGPSAETVAATLAAIERSSRPAVLARIAAKLRPHPIAASIVLVLPIATAVLSLLIPSLGPARRSAAFGAVLEQIRSAQTVQFRISYSMSDQPTQTRRVLSKGDRTRVEFDQGPIMITDPDAGRILTLMPDVNKAFLAPMPADSGQPQANESALLYFARVKNLQNEPGAYRGVRDEDGHQLAEFQTEQKGARFSILADPQTDRPVRITMEVPLFEASVVMSDFVFDAELSDDLFSLTPPDGYELIEQPDTGEGVVASDPQSGQSVSQTTVTVTDADLSQPVEQDVVECLRALAELHQGRFPSAAVFKDPMNNLATSLVSRVQAAGEAEQQELTQQVFRSFLKSQRSKAYFKQVVKAEPMYVGEGVTQGEAERPVLAWAVPGSNQARIVFGDLSIKDVDPASLSLAADVVQRSAGSTAPPPADQPAPASPPAKQGTARPHAYFGMQVSTMPDKSGVRVDRIAPRSPAEAAGIKAGDIITHVDGRFVPTVRDLYAATAEKQPGDKAVLDVRREEQELKLELIAAAPPGQPARTDDPPPTSSGMSAATERDFINYIRMLAELNNGVFPSGQEAAQLIQQMHERRQRAETLTSQEQEELKRQLMICLRAGRYAQRITASPTPLGGNVKLGDSSKPVFAWALPDQKIARVAYGDLQVHEMAMDSPEFKAIIAKEAPNLPYAGESNWEKKAPPSRPAR